MKSRIRSFLLYPFFPLVLALALRSEPETLLEGPGLRVVFDDGHVQIAREKAVLIDVTSIEFNFHAPKSVVVGERTADRVILKAIYPSEARYVGETGDLPVELMIERVAGGVRFTAKPDWAQNVTVRLRDLDDHFFGLLEMLYPNNKLGSDLRGVTVDVDALGNELQYHENYASVWSAFYMTAKGYASFFDTFAKGRYKLAVDGETELYHQTGALNWYVFLGSDGDELLASYYRVIGRPKMPPMWMLGPMGWRDQNDGGAPEICEDVRHMTELKIPFTSWFVDRPYCDGGHEWSKMNFSAKFARPEEWIAKLKNEYGLRFMSWIAPMTFGDPDFPGLFEGDFSYMDLTDPAAVQELERRLKLQYAVGVCGHKNDRSEERFPAVAKWKDGTPEPEHRNKYVYLYAKVTHEILTRAWGDDQCNFARAAFHRTQPYLTALWGGDCRSSWDGLASNLANAMRCGFMGFPLWGSDTGGYLGGHIDEELYARWLEWGAWNGLFEIKLDDVAGKNQDRPPWTYGENLQSAFREACEQRMQLLPYLYSLSHTASRTGVLMKPLAYAWPLDSATYAIWDEYLFGPAFLVAPLTAPGGQRTVYLPQGRWHDFYEPVKVFAGKQNITVTAPFNHIPIFVRDNSVYVTGSLPLGNRRVWADDAKSSYTVHVLPGSDGQGSTFELIDSLDQNKSKLVRQQSRGAATTISVPALGAEGEVQVMASAMARIRVNRQVVATKYEPALAGFRVPFAANTSLEIEVLTPELAGSTQK